LRGGQRHFASFAAMPCLAELGHVRQRAVNAVTRRAVRVGVYLVAQYDQYEALPGLKVNGRLTAGENIGDLGGLTVALEAFHMSLDGKPSPVIDGFSGEQRFFLAWGQAWREIVRDEALRNQVMSNPHSPAVFRVNGVVPNMDAWYSAFDVKPEDKMYIPPEKRVKIW
jgi:predicted metalloendopeptidase